MPEQPASTSTLVPVIAWAGQSNVNASQIDHRLVQPLHDSGGAFEFEKLGQGGTSIFASSRVDWNSASDGELFDQLVSKTLAAIQNAEQQGRTPDVTLFFAQGESDKQSSSADYGRELRALIDAFRLETGVPDARIVLLLLPYDCGPRTAMLDAANDIPGVFTIETVGLPTFDGVHYTDASSEVIANRFSDIVPLSGPQIDGYQNLLDQGYFIERPDKAIYASPEFLQAEFVHTDARNYQVRTSSGDDHIVTGSGVDSINSGVGADEIDVGAGNDIVQAGKGDDRIFGRAGDDILRGDSGDDRIFGGDGNDTIELGDQRDLGLGEAGDDILNGGLGGDILWGGTGADRFVYTSALDSLPGARNADLVRDFEQGIDLIDLSALGSIQFNTNGHYSGGSAQITFSVMDGRTVLKADLDGDRVSDFIIQFTGEIHFDAGDFLFG